MPLRPWNHLPIQACSEPLVPLPAELLRLEPHPYQALGAPYGRSHGPFQLRQGVLTRLLQAQEHLQRAHPDLRLAIFDGWRPLAVQAFMVDHAIAQTCAQRGLSPRDASPAVAAVVEEVGRFWAPPNRDPLAPPPHSTGAAVDLTLASVASGTPLDLGGAIDTIGPVSEPDHWLKKAQLCNDPSQRLRYQRWHCRRRWLLEAMARAGFCQHPNEWWHYSYGDQLWAWRLGRPTALYGRLEDSGGG